MRNGSSVMLPARVRSASARALDRFPVHRPRVEVGWRLMRPGLGRAVCLASLLVLVGFIATSAFSSPRSSASPVIRLYVCGDRAFDYTTRKCTRDQRGEAVVTRFVACYAAISGHPSGESKDPGLTANWLYGGDGMPGGKFGTFSDGSILISLYANAETGSFGPQSIYDAGTPPRPEGEPIVPGGIYRCIVRAGNRVTSARIKSVGPTGNLVDAMICSDKTSRQRLCQRDEDGATLPVGSRIVCDAIYPDATAHEADLTVVDASGATVGKPLRLGIGRALWIAQNRTEPITHAGRITCRFGLDGMVLAQREVRIGAG